jgi:hypothetical protein
VVSAPPHSCADPEAYGVIGEHPEFGSELKQLAQQILLVLDPVIQAAAVFAPTVGGEPGKCQQVWCPVCAIAAIASGEEHPVAAIVVEHGAALLSVVRAMANSKDAGPADGGTRAESPEQEKTPGTYQPIPITIHE